MFYRAAFTPTNRLSSTSEQQQLQQQLLDQLDSIFDFNDAGLISTAIDIRYPLLVFVREVLLNAGLLAAGYNTLLLAMVSSYGCHQRSATTRGHYKHNTLTLPHPKSSTKDH